MDEPAQCPAQYQNDYQYIINNVAKAVKKLKQTFPPKINFITAFTYAVGPPHAGIIPLPLPFHNIIIFLIEL